MSFLRKRRKHIINHYITGKSILEWQKEQNNDDSFLSCDSMDAQLALDYLFEYFEIPPSTMPLNNDQGNAYTVFYILNKYSKAFKEERKEYNSESTYSKQ